MVHNPSIRPSFCGGCGVTKKHFPSMVDNLLLKLFVFPTGSIGRTVYLPTFTIKITHIHVGKHMMEGSYGRYVFGWSTPWQNIQRCSPRRPSVSCDKFSFESLYDGRQVFWRFAIFVSGSFRGVCFFVPIGMNHHILIS